jgi:hypothetical protein
MVNISGTLFEPTNDFKSVQTATERYTSYSLPPSLLLVSVVAPPSMTTPVAPLRIRIQSHAPLPALKLWFSIPSASTSSSLDDLSLSIHQFLVVQGLDARIKIVLELQGKSA